jgi:hypothetical protein
MKRIFFALSLMMLLAACTALPANTTPSPVETAVPTLPPVTQFVPTETASSPKLPAASFEAQTYIDETVGFAFDYPVGWTVNEGASGGRGSEMQFLSSPELVNAPTLPEGATRVSATVYLWEPKNDLAAYIAQRKTAWEASGFAILEEKPLVLELGLPAVQFTVQTPETQVVFLITAIGDQYLVVSGEGNLELVKEIVQRVRPISR